MKTIKLLLGILIVMISYNNSTAQPAWLLAGNTITGTEFLGANAGSTVPLKFGTRAAQTLNFEVNSYPSGLIDWGPTSANTSFGYQTFYSLTGGTFNSLFGYQAGKGLTTGGNNSFFGYQAGVNNAGGSYNTIFGCYAGITNNSGHSNVFIGESSGYSNYDAHENTFIGKSAGYFSNKDNNTFIGAFSGSVNTDGLSNTFLGEECGDSNTDGNDNLAAGRLAGHTNHTGNYNIFLGTTADALTGYNNLKEATAIGFTAKVATDYTMILGNDSINVGIGLSSSQLPSGPQGKLDVENDVTPIAPATAVDYAGMFNNFGTTSDPVTMAVSGINYANCQGWNFGGYFAAVNAVVTNVGVDGSATKPAGYNVGAIGEAYNADNYNTGVFGNATSTIGKANYGGHFEAQGATTVGGTNFGVMAEVQGGKQNFGVYSIVYPGIPPMVTPAATNIAIYGNCQPSPVTNPPSAGLNWAGYFDGDVDINGTGWHNGATIFTSDQMFKTHIDTITDAISILRRLKPKTYYMDTTNVYGMHFSNKRQYGFIAQDVITVLPELVSETTKPAMVDSTGAVITPSVNYKGLNYIEFIALITKGMQEQSRTIDSIKSQMQALSDMINNCCNSNHTHGANYNPTNPTNDVVNTDVKLSDAQNIVLDDNVPNPFATETTIGYNLPDNTGKAEMLFYNAGGRLIKSVELTNKGRGQVNVFAEDLTNGIYTYTLVVDGKIFETKKMVKQ